MSIQIHNTNALTALAKLPDQSVHCVVTSPPYFGLRDYGHEGQIGLEATPQEYAAKLVNVFREVKRVLRDDGTVWLNLGDSYGCGKRSQWAGDAFRDQKGVHTNVVAAGAYGRGTVLPDKQLMGIPWRVAFALQDDGWYLRQDIIWAKPNPMPESVTDRCTKSHEYIFMLSKHARYYYDAEAIKLPPSENSHGAPLPNPGDKQRAIGQSSGKSTLGVRASDKQRGHSRRHAGFNDRWDAMSKDEQVALGANRRSVWTLTTQPYKEAHFATFPPALPELCIKAGCPEGGTVLDCFAGAGTTGLVADRLGRDAILIEINPEYAEMARARIYGDLPMFAEVEVSA